LHTWYVLSEIRTRSANATRSARLFFAYPSNPVIVGETVEQAITNLRLKSGIDSVHSWRENDIAGRFIAHQVLEEISVKPIFFADVTQLNFNVSYEIGFALSKEKRVVLTRLRGIASRFHPRHCPLREKGSGVAHFLRGRRS
jgi:hypothetical protein